MAGHIQDRWYKVSTGPNGKAVKVKTDRHGSGLRYRARYVGPDGSEKSKSFPDGKKRLAEKWLSAIETDMTRGQYTDPKSIRITFREYAEKWLDSKTSSPMTRKELGRRLRLHAFPVIGSRPMGTFRPEHIRGLLAALEAKPGVSPAYARNIFADVQSVLSAAVDDSLLSRNPCSARTVRRPRLDAHPVTPWTLAQVLAVRTALLERYRPMVDVGAGCGLRQGEVFGLAEDAIDTDGRTLHVVQQIKHVEGHPVFALPKGGKKRDVPLPDSVAEALRAHRDVCKPVEITLPWGVPEGPKVSARLLFTAEQGGMVWRSNFNGKEWKPALAAAGLIPDAGEDGKYDSAREHGMHALRHFYASALLDAGENIKAVSEYMGHADPGMTLRVYAHLMPDSRERARRAIDSVFRYGPEGADGP
ncbi:MULTISPECIES: tyrosine-type recombinase/integrase [unclassified Streptomyces]|uniref:tyrosine-type recombinase/integrase n=1 Tax=unclassified Streptomyces TaxID=2593676 RepID=UPI00087A0E8C|nr:MULTISPECIES: site-specific integrase [unclassified Streptomyces]REH21902.1 site-specific recombinase XerD [Streptomyces sp. 2221.1]SDT61353.1 Site-specific recombinase XerD [Streptomyces sp. 2114.2]